MDRAVVFFDGGCGLCHRAVSFVVRRDRAAHFRYAPLGGSTFLRRVAEPDRFDLPDSLVVLTQDARLLTRSTAVFYLLRQTGGVWRIVAGLLGMIPRTIRDALYDFIARIRFKLFAQPTDTCPLLPPHLASRFDP